MVQNAALLLHITLKMLRDRFLRLVNCIQFSVEIFFNMSAVKIIMGTIRPRILTKDLHLRTYKMQLTQQHLLEDHAQRPDPVWCPL